MSDAEPCDGAQPSERLLLVRHRQSTWNVERRWSAQADPPLSEQGESDALAVGPVIAPLGFDAIVSSDLARARRTAELIRAAMPGVPLHLDDRLRELDIPAWAGRTKDEIAASHPDDYARWRSGVSEPPAGSEPWPAFERRVVAALHDSAGRGGTVLVVAHSGVLRAVRSALQLPDKVGRSKGIWIHRYGHRLVPGPLQRVTDGSPAEQWTRSGRTARASGPGAAAQP